MSGLVLSVTWHRYIYQDNSSSNLWVCCTLSLWHNRAVASKQADVVTMGMWQNRLFICIYVYILVSPSKWVKGSYILRQNQNQCTRIHIYTYAYACTYTQTHICICSVCVCLCMCVFYFPFRVLWCICPLSNEAILKGIGKYVTLIRQELHDDITTKETQWNLIHILWSILCVVCLSPSINVQFVIEIWQPLNRVSNCFWIYTLVIRDFGLLNQLILLYWPYELFFEKRKQ